MVQQGALGIAPSLPAISPAAPAVNTGKAPGVNIGVAPMGVCGRRFRRWLIREFWETEAVSLKHCAVRQAVEALAFRTLSEAARIAKGKLQQ
jgi:hypothetical protein